VGQTKKEAMKSVTDNRKSYENCDRQIKKQKKVSQFDKYSKKKV
jgi:hypothetical protein